MAVDVDVDVEEVVELESLDAELLEGEELEVDWSSEA